MTTTHRFLLAIPDIKAHKHVPIFCKIYHSLVSRTTDLHSTRLSDPYPSSKALPASIQDQVITLANELANCSNLWQSSQIHAHVIRTHMLELQPFPFHWNNLIRAYTRQDAPFRALRVYIAMSRAGVLPDSYTLPIVVKAAAQLFATHFGRQVHSVAIRLGLESNVYCESGLISLYCKAAEFVNARKVFDENSDRTLGSWNALIGGLSQGGHAKEAVEMFRELRKSGILPDNLTMVSVTSACGSLGDLKLALQLHNCVFQCNNVEKPDIQMLNSLIDMYGKCGRMDLAYKVFSRMDQPNVLSWTSMIMGYAMHGHVTEALECFGCMREAEVRPNHVTFVGVLSACVHGGRVREGRLYFEMMKNVYGILPKLQHYGCMVDLLGRAGLLEEAREVIEGMPMAANEVIWGCLMGACEKHGDVEMGEWVAKHLIELEPWNDGVYVVLSNIYADGALWEEVERIRGIMKQRKLAKVPAYSFAATSI
ncbi:pentatricopeptide repeat-containing protein At1g77170 [Carica papaya]|uniref:pentatricopeptide repeat-containing protein At1g77170 n=1 Tax=Carica papaya TaxID=3649 RepID=UPI000B8CEAA9|nr:pentatricopeptide repeat-containing protein At1g77170 [Carica papaya]